MAKVSDSHHLRSSVRTVRDYFPVYLLGTRIDGGLTVTVEVTATFGTDEGAASFEAAVRELLEKA